MAPNFIQELQNKRCNYNHPDQATSQANSLILLSSGIYTEEERFIFELLQNAVDAHNNSVDSLNVKIILEKDYLIFLHNGDAFTERDIEGLCDVGNGNKMKDIKKIGYKGIGFKSVFMRSTNVTVQSGGYCFKFDKTHWENYWDLHWNASEYGVKNEEKKYLMPWQIIPIETVPPITIDTNGFNVVTYIQIKGKNSIEQKICNLLSNSQFLLFLKSDNIQMSFIIEGDIHYQINKSKEGKQIVLSSNDIEDSRWLLHCNDKVEVPLYLKDSIYADINTPDKLKEAKTFDLSFAIALDKSGKLKPLRKEESIIYTYLPTSYRFGIDGFPFLVNANFITDAGRQQLHKDSEWNKLIFSKIPSEYLSWMRDISNEYNNYWEVLPEKSYGRSNTLEITYADNMENAIKEIAFIPTLQNVNQKVLVSEAFMDRMGIADAISVHALVGHISRTYSHLFDVNNQISNIKKGSVILQNYGVFIFDKQKLKGLFDDKKAFENISFELDIKLINYLFNYYLQYKTEQDELISILQSTQFLLDENNSLCLPKDLFFPSSYKEQNALADNAKLLHNEVYNAINLNNQIIDWLSILGVEHLSDITFIKNVICKTGYITKENAVEVGRFLFDINKKINIFEKVGNYYLSDLKFISKKESLLYARDLFLGSNYKPEIDIECVCDEDIYISEKYCDKGNTDEWKIFFKNLGVNDSISLTKIQLNDTLGFSILEDAKAQFKKLYNISYTGNVYNYNFHNFQIYYVPFILTNNCSRAFQKLIWSTIFANEYILQEDYVNGQAGWYSEYRSFKELINKNFIEWALSHIQLFPSTNDLFLSKDKLFINTSEIKEIGGQYLPIIDINSEIHDSWKDLLHLKDTINLSNCLDILTKISCDIVNLEQNKERICKIYQRLIELDALSENNREKIKEWASSNLILSIEDKFVSPAELSYITLDGFNSKNRVYIGNLSNKEKIIELLALMGVKIITSESIKTEFEEKTESNELKNILKNKVSVLALLASGENADEILYRSNKSKLMDLIEFTYFYNCKKIKLTYGDSADIIEKHSFGNKNEFYYIGNLRPSNVEPLSEPLCKYLGIKGKEKELFVMFFDDMDGIKLNLKDKGYNIDLIEDDDIVVSGNITVSLDYHPNESAQERNMITGFKGEIIVYEKLISMGYKPICPSISTQDDYDKEVIVNGKTYYCKPNYNSEYDIYFETENRHKILLEVKSTTTSVGYIENMPISCYEWSMIKECDKKQDKSYIIVRVFGVDSPKQDIYLFKSHLFE